MMKTSLKTSRSLARLFALFAFATLPLMAKADLKSNFAHINSTYKGPFGLNVLQGPKEREEIRGGGHVSNVQFQAAYRNDRARAMATQDGFWTGNLFTTNYYELMGEYVYGDAYSSHELDHARLAAAGPTAITKAASMMQHWVLEKHYISAFPKSEIAKSFTLRGISDSANETEYANYFFSFYVTATAEDLDYLPAFILVNKSPIVESASLGKARDLVAQAYEYYSGTMPDEQTVLQAMYRLRNAIHNQLTKSVIGQIDDFIRIYPQFRDDGYFSQIRQILVDYYAISPTKISAQAKKLGMTDLKSAADELAKKPGDVDALLELSRIASGWRANLSTQIAFEKRGQALALLADTAKILNKELSSLSSSSLKSPKALESVLNTVYLEGFIIKDNLNYFRTEIASSTQPAAVLADVLDAATDTLSEAFKPAFGQWVSVEPKMQGFIDSTIKGSALNTVATTIEKLKR